MGWEYRKGQPPIRHFGNVEEFEQQDEAEKKEYERLKEKYETKENN